MITRLRLPPRWTARVVAVLASLQAASCTAAESPDEPVVGAADSPTSAPLPTETAPKNGAPPEPPADAPAYTVTDYRELAAALAKVSNGEIIYVADTADIDLTGKPAMKLGAGVTLKSGRGIAGSKGARLFSTNEGQLPLIDVVGEGVTISGLRIEGPVKAERATELKALLAKNKYYDMPLSRGIVSASSKTTVEYSELFGWTHCAICLNKGTDHVVRENYIHHNARYGLGYGVMTEAVSTLVTKNLFDRNRHAIASTGKPGSSYEASANVVFRGTYVHDFDVHGGADRGDGTNIAGKTFVLHDNRFYSTVSHNFLIRGVPQDRVSVTNESYVFTTLASAVAVSNVGTSRDPAKHPTIFSIGAVKLKITRPAGIPTAPDAYLPAALAPLPAR